MSPTDKKYNLYQTVKSVNWIHAPNTFEEFVEKLKDSSYVSGLHSFSKELNLLSADKSPEEFNNWLGLNEKMENNTIVTDRTEDPYKTRRAIESIPEYIFEEGYNMLKAIGEFGIDEFKAEVLGDYEQKLENLKDKGELFQKGVVLLAAAKEELKYLFAEGYTPEFRNYRDYPVKSIEERGKVKEEIQRKALETFSQNRKDIKNWFVERGLSREQPSLIGEVFGGMGFTLGIMATALVPGGIPVGFGLGMSMEGMNLAADIYEETGDLDKAKIGFVVGNISGMTEMFTPLEAISFAKGSLKNLIKKDIKNKMAHYSTRFGAGVVAREGGKQFAIESTQEMFQTGVEQATKIYVDVPGADWDVKEIIKAGWIGGFTGLLFGLGSGTAALNKTIEKTRENINEYIDKELPGDLNKYVKLNVITKEQGKEITDNMKAVASDPVTFIEMANRELENLENKLLEENVQYRQVMEMAKDLGKVFQTPTTKEGTEKAEALADLYRKQGIELNNIDLYLLNKGVDPEEYGGIENFNVWTDAVKRTIEQDSKFKELKAKIGKEQNIKRQELTDRTHSEILNNPAYIENIKMYFNTLSLYAPALKTLEEMKKPLSEIDFLAVPEDVIGESRAAAIESQIEDIEKRRQEHLEKRRNDLPDKWGKTIINKNDNTETRNYTGKKFSDGLMVEVAEWSDQGGVGEKDPYKMIINTIEPGIWTDEIITKKPVVKIGIFKDKQSADKWLENEKERRIGEQPKREATTNAKYDAELAALQSKKLEMQGKKMYGIQARNRLGISKKPAGTSGHFREETGYKKLVSSEEAKRFLWRLGKYNARYGTKYSFTQRPTGSNTIELVPNQKFEEVIQAPQGKLFEQEGKPVEGINISSYESGLGGKLTNFAKIPVTFRGKSYPSSEAAYQANKGKLDDTGVLNLMIEIIQAKLEQHPELIQEITDKGGIEFLKESTHNLIKQGKEIKKDRWTGKGGLFMRALRNAYYNITNAGIKPRQMEAVQAPKLVNSTSTTEVEDEMSSAVSMTAEKVFRRLDEKGFTNETIRELGLWLAEKYGNIPLIKDSSIDARGSYHWNPDPEKEAYISYNPSHPDNDSNYAVSNTIIHETFHNATHDRLDNDGMFRKQVQELFNQAKERIVGSTFYEAHKADLDRIFGLEDENVALHEFLTWGATGVESSLRGWLRDNYIAPNTPFLKELVQRILDAFVRFFNKHPKRITFLQAIETILNQTLGMPTTEIPAFPDAVFLENRSMEYETADLVDKAIALDEELLNDKVGLQSFLDSLELDIGTDPYEYVQNLDRQEFDDLVANSPRLQRKMELYYEENLKDKISYEEYKRAVSVYTYLNIKNMQRRTSALLNITNGAPTVKFVNTQFKDFKGNPRSPYQAKTMLDKLLPAIEEALGTKLEIVYLEDIRDSRGLVDKTGKPMDFLGKLGNEELKDLYGQVGIIFPGTWADKNTAIGFRVLGEKITDEKWLEIKEVYDVKIKALIEAGKVGVQYGEDTFDQKQKPKAEEKPFIEEDVIVETVTEGLNNVSKASILRALMEDFKLGGKYINGELQSALFNPEPGYEDTYDAIKLFKRPYLLAPMFEIEQMPEEVNYIVKQVVDEVYAGNAERSGIVVRNGKIYYRTIIFNDKPGGDSNAPIPITLNGKTFDLRKILIDQYGTPVCDGATIFPINAAGRIYRYMIGSLKTGALKFWGGNNIEGEFSSPFFLKTAGHEYSQEDNIIKWMADNGIAMLLPASSVKVNRYGIDEINPSTGVAYEGQVVEVPLQNLFRIQEKDTAEEFAKGLQQLLTTNYLVEANENLEDPKEFLRLMRNFTDSLLKRFYEKMALIDPKGLLDYVKNVITNPTNEYHRQLSDVLSTLLFNYADERLDELTEASATLEKDKTPQDVFSRAVYKELLREAQRDVRLSNQTLGKKIANLFYHPYFSRLFTDYMHTIVKDMIYYEIPSSYNVIAPDLGALAQTRMQLASNYALTATKNKMEQEIANVYFGQVQPKEEQIGILQEEVTAVEKKSTVLQKEIEGLQAAEEAAVKEEKEESAIELKKRVDEALAEMEQFEKEIENKENEIKKIQDELKEPLKQVEGFIKEGKVVIDGRNPAVQTERDKLLYQWLDPESGRIKGDYNYISADTARKHNIKLGDTIITNFIPADSAQSATGASVIGIMSSSISEDSKIVGWTEYYESQAGKDNDLDTAFLIPYNEVWGTRMEFQKLADILKKTKNNYPAYILAAMKSVLKDESLTLKDIYRKDIRLKYMQAIGEAVKAPDVYNPLYNQNLLDKYEKKIAIPVNKRKMATAKSAMNFRTRFTMFDINFNVNVNDKNNKRTHTAHIIETNAQVDIPNDDTALKYTLSDAASFDLDNGTNIRGTVGQLYRAANEQQKKLYQYSTPKYIKMFNDIDKFLFGYGVGLSTKNNLDDRNEKRSLKESVSYMMRQNQINEMLQTTEGREALAEDFIERFRRTNSWLSSGAMHYLTTAARQYITNIRIENIEDFLSMYLLENADLSVIPNLQLNKQEYLTIEHQVARVMLSLFSEIDTATKEVYQKHKQLINDYGQATANKDKRDPRDARLDKILFLLTKSDPQLHILKGKILRLINMFIKPESLLVPQHNLTKFEKDLSVEVDEQIYGDIVLYALEKDLQFSPTAKKIVVNYDNKGLFIEPAGNTVKLTLGEVSIYGKDLKRLDEAGDTTAKKMMQMLKEGTTGEKSKVKSDNRRDISGLIDFSNTLHLSDRFTLIEELVISEYQNLNNPDKEKLLFSLLSFSEEANESLYSYSKETGYTNSRFLTLIGLLKDSVSHNFFERYAISWTEAVPYPGFTNSYNITAALESTEADWEVWNMFGLPQTKQQKNLHSYILEEKILPYQKGQERVTTVVNLTTGVVQGITNNDVRRLTSVEAIDDTKDVPIGDVRVLTAALEASRRSVGSIEAFYQVVSEEITAFEARAIKLEAPRNEKNKELSDPLKSQRRSAFRTKVADIIENNLKPDGLHLRIEKVNNEYIYKREGQTFKTVNELLDAAGIEVKERYAYQAAIKWQEVYSIENIQFIDSMLNYLSTIFSDFAGDTYTTKILLSMIKRYRKHRDRMLGMQFEYFPRIYRDSVFEGTIKNYLKAQEAERIEREIIDAVRFIEEAPANIPIPDSLRDLAAKAGNQAWINEQAVNNMKNEQYNYYVGSFEGHVNAFSLKRDLPDMIEVDAINEQGELVREQRKLYIRDQALPHQRHQAAMIKMFDKDLAMVAYLNYQSKAIINGANKKLIDEIRMQMASIYGIRSLLNREIDVKEITPGMEISFFTEDSEFVAGTVDRTDKKYVYLKMDKDQYRKHIQKKIKENERIDLEVQRSSFYNNEVTARQHSLLSDLLNQGYLNGREVLEADTKTEASRKINQGLRRMLLREENWGRYSKSDMYRQYPGKTETQIQSGAYRFMEYGAIERLKGMTRELRNSYDNTLSQMTFGEIVSNKLLYPYLKTVAYSIPVYGLKWTSWSQAHIGISTPGGGAQNMFDGVAAVIRDRGFFRLQPVQLIKAITHFITGKGHKGEWLEGMSGAIPILLKTKGLVKEIKTQIEEGELGAFSEGLQTIADRRGQKRFVDEKEAVKRLTLETMLENMLVYDDYFTDAVLNNFDELFTKDERDKVEYSILEKCYQIIKTVKDSWGYKEYRNTIRELNKQLFDAIKTEEILRLSSQIEKVEKDWYNLKNSRLEKLMKNPEYQKEVMGDEELLKMNLAEVQDMTASDSMKMMWHALKKSRGGKIAGFLLGMRSFKAAEGWNRRMAIVQYVYEEVVIKGETDPDKIKAAAMRGIARTQAMYELFDRRLGDRTQLGRALLMFGHYNFYIKQVAERRIAQAKEEHRTDIKRKFVKEFARDTVLLGVDIMIQGLRIGSPVNAVMWATILFLLNVMKRIDEGDEPIDWEDPEVKELVQDFLSFKLGFGATLPLNIAYNSYMDKDQLFSYGRMGKGVEMVRDEALPLIFGEDTEISDNYLYENWRQMRLISRYLISANIIAPAVYPDLDEDLKEHYRQGILERLRDIGKEAVIPGYPLIKYGTDFDF